MSISGLQYGERSNLLYRVHARPIEVALPKLHALLIDGTIANQEPDGKEIIASMKRATINAGRVEWNETCYCSRPLRHERATVYDQFFTDIRIEPATSNKGTDRASFWTYLETRATENPMTGESPLSGSITRTLGRNTV